MSFRNWLHSSPFGVGIAIALLLALAASQNWQKRPENGNEAAAQYHRVAAQDRQEASVAPVAGIETPPPNPKPERNEWRSESDLEAQWKAANWNEISAIASCLALAVAILGLLYVKKTLDANVAVVAAADRALIADNRPWLAVEPTLASDLTFSKKSGTIKICFKIRNTGNSPALNAMLMVHLIALDTKCESLLLSVTRQQTEYYPAVKPDRKSLIGMAFFPGDDFPINRRLTLNRDEIERFTKPGKDGFPIFLVGSVSYLSATDERVHHTGFIYEIRRPKPGQRNLSLYFGTDEPVIGLDDIELIRDHSSGYVD